MEALVIATNRLDKFETWLNAWQEQIQEASDLHLFVMHDTESEDETIKVPIPPMNHNHVKSQLKDNAWIIPKKSGACKSWAIYQAWKAGAERLYCLDDDCLPAHDQLFDTHKRRLSFLAQNQMYFTLDHIRPRGVPYLPMNPVMLNHGLWENIPDIDAITQIKGYPTNSRMKHGFVPQGTLFPFCGMNWACNRQIMPLMYFGLHGEGWPVDRFDDIWCGFIAKKIMDHLGYAVWSGNPTVNHSRASDPFVNIVKEAPGYKMNCEVYEFAMNLSVEGGTPVECMKSTGQKLISWARYKKIGLPNKYFEKYGEAIQIWASLFEA